MPAPLSRLSARAALRLRNEPMSPSPSARRLPSRSTRLASGTRPVSEVQEHNTTMAEGPSSAVESLVFSSSSLTLYHEIRHHHHRRARRF